MFGYTARLAELEQGDQSDDIQAQWMWRNLYSRLRFPLLPLGLCKGCKQI